MFLLLPTRHTANLSGLTPEEIDTMHIVRQALVAVLKETHPRKNVAGYLQNGPQVGQTVFHYHEQVVAYDPETIAFSWIFMSLFGAGRVSDEEMARVTAEFKIKMEQELAPPSSRRRT